MLFIGLTLAIVGAVIENRKLVKIGVIIIAVDLIASAFIIASMHR